MKQGRVYVKIAKGFTLVELILSMSIFAVLMLVLMQIFGSTQDVWRKTSAKADSYESARIALNIIAEDLGSAVYVADVAGESFNYNAPNLWFVAKKKYTINSNQKGLEAEVLFNLRAYSTQENALEDVPVGVNLFKLDYYIMTDDSGNCDFRTNSSAHSTVDSSPRGVLLDNVLSFSVVPLYVYKRGGIVHTKNCNTRLPNMVMVSLEVLDSDHAVRLKYKNATAAEKKLISRTFVRVISIKKGQSYPDIEN